jgi:hypothetical protein
VPSVSHAALIVAVMTVLLDRHLIRRAAQYSKSGSLAILMTMRQMPRTAAAAVSEPADAPEAEGPLP